MTDSDTRLASLDYPALAHWMQAQGLGAGNIRNATLLAGGTQNLIVRFRLGEREYVLRKAATSAYANGSETMRREARVLAALAHTAVPHARLIAACPDEDVLGGAFYLMEAVDGFNVGMGMPEPHASQPDWRHAMGLAMVDGLATLRQLDHVALGLADFGKTDSFLQRQVGRWRTQLESYMQYTGWPGSQGLPHVDTVGHWLERHMPLFFQPGIQHGDYHIKNVLYSHDRPALAAIIDWELCTIGDPLIDLGWLLATWRDPGEVEHGSPIVIEPWDGFPTAAELVAYYAERTGVDVSNIGWYAVFACYKLALLLEGTYARSCAGKVEPALGARFHHNAGSLLQRANKLIG